MTPRLSVIVPVGAGGVAFQRCLHGLRAQTLRELEILFVVDGPVDCGDPAAQIACRVIRLPERGGAARARNRGAQVAQAEVLFFVDADVELPPEAAAIVDRVMTEQPEISAVFGAYDDDPGEKNFLSQYRNLFHAYVHARASQDATTFWTGCGAVRRAAFREVGGFRESLISLEDIDLGYRLHEAGKRIRLDLRLRAKHWRRYDVRSLLYIDFYLRGVCWTRLLLARPARLRSDLNLGWAHRIGALLALASVGEAVLAPRRPSLAIPCLVATLFAFVAWNWPLYRYFQRRRGWGFALLTIPWNFSYYLYSSAALAYGITERLWRRPKLSERD